MTVSSPNSFGQGWRWFKQGLTLLKHQRKIAAFALLYAFAYIGLTVLGTRFAFDYSSLLHLFVTPLVAYFYCRLYERSVLDLDAERPLVARLKGKLGPIVLMGFLFALVSLTAQLVVKGTSDPGAGIFSLRMAAALVGATINWIVASILNLAVWMMAIQELSITDALSKGIITFFSHILSFIGLTIACVLFVIPSLLVFFPALFFRAYHGTQTDNASLNIWIVMITVGGILLAVSMVSIIAAAVFFNFEAARSLFDERRVDRSDVSP
ncbi:MAG: hypothetical protein ABIR96_12700 [Bdellovibrionota bacterium]